MQSFSTVLITAIIVQFLVELIKKPIPSKYRNWAVPLLAVFFGELICISGSIDIFAILGVTLSPNIVGYILSGLAVSGGSAAINELIKSLAELRPSNCSDSDINVISQKDSSNESE